MFQAFLIRWVFNAAALFVAAWLLSGISYGDDWWALLIASLVFTLVHIFVKPVIAFLSIPFIIVTLGLAYFLINVLMLYLTDWIVGDFNIKNFGSAVLGAIIVSVVNIVLQFALGRFETRERPAY